MSVYKIFSEQDAFINSQFPTANTGKDKLLEIANYKDASGTQRFSRTLITFSTQQLQEVVTNIIGTSTPFESSLQLYLAEASEVPTQFTIDCIPVSQSWQNGTGKFNDSPIDLTGVSYNFRLANQQGPWTTAGGDFFSGSAVSQSFELDSNLDLNFNVTSTVVAHVSESLDNYGFIIKLSNNDEANVNLNATLRYFSKDTNSIFPPQLALKWDDSVYQTGSLDVLDDTAATINITNNKGVYFNNEVSRFRLSPRPTYPVRTFTTGSIFKQIFALPEDSTWALKDEASEEMIIDFDSEYTKISCDQKGPYLDIYMEGLQPERYYRLLFKTELDNSVRVVDNNNIFKIVRHVQ